MEDEQKDLPKADAPYIREKIVKKKHSPFRILSRILLCICMAVIFGAVAGFVFVVVKPWAEQIGIGNEPLETGGSSVSLPTFSPPDGTRENENTTSDSLEESTSSLDDSELNFNVTQREWIINQITSRIDRNTLDIEDENEISKAIYRQYVQAAKSVSIIRGIDENGGYFGQILWEATGLLFYQIEESKELLILADSTGIKNADRIQVTIPSLADKTFNASVKGQDHIFGLMVLSVSTEGLRKEELEKIQVIELGNVYQVKECETVLLIGSPYVLTNSVAVGSITYIDRGRITLDSVYRLFYTDITVPENGTGFMINTSGQLIGIITNALKDSGLQQYAAAIGTEEINSVLNNMCSGISGSLLGVYGQNVTQEMSEITGMPQGVYVTDVQVDGPAYNSGISSGDIITKISMASITSMTELFDAMNKDHLPGETVIVTVMREGLDGYKEIEFNVTLGGR